MEMANLDSQYDKLKDLSLSTSIAVPAQSVEIKVELPGSNEDTSYGIDKVIFYGDKADGVNDWEVYYESELRDQRWPCNGTEEDNSVSAKTVAGNDDPGFVAEIVCDDNVQTKTLYLKRATDSDANLQEVVIAGLPSSKFPCDVGWIPGTQPCERCPEGKYGTTTDSVIDCAECNAGTYSFYVDNFTPNLNCVDCEPGTYSAAGAAKCTSCEAGTVQSQSGQTSCNNCQPGEFQSQTRQTTCEKCSPGYYSEEKSSACIPCKAGEISTEDGAIACTKCEAGKYQKDPGQSECLSCSPGTFSNEEGASSCAPCPKGQFSIKGGISCDICPEGTYQGDEGQTSCIDCGPGTFNNGTGKIQCEQCPLGYYGNDKKLLQCVACEKGNFQDQSGMTSCKPCPTLKHQNEVGKSECIPCQEGSYSLEGWEECQTCDDGTFFDETTSSCAACPPGHYATSGDAQCTKCDLMMYQPNSKSSECLPCPTGEFSDTLGSVECKKCPRGSYRGETDQDTCIECDAGYYTDVLGSSKCKKCPTGSYSSGAGSSICEPCDIGHFQDKVEQKSCLECPVGSYSNEKGQTVCKKCGKDTVSREEGSYSCEQCEYNFYSPEEGGTACIQCPKRAAYQPPSCPPVIPNCAALVISNQYGSYTFPEEEPPDGETGISEKRTCHYALFIDDKEVFGEITSECKTWKEGEKQMSAWSTPSFKDCGTEKTKEIYENTKKAREAIKAAEENGGGIENAKIDPDVAKDMLESLIDISGSDNNGGDNGNNNGGDNGNNNGGDSGSEGSSLGASDVSNVVTSLAVVANSVSPTVLAEPKTRDNILSSIDNFAQQDDNFVEDAGTDATDAAVKVVESIGESILQAGSGNGSEPTESKAIVTPTMTIVPTPIDDKTYNEPVQIDLEEDEEQEDTTKGEEEESQDPIIATEEPQNIILPADSEDDERATKAPILVKVTNPPLPPIKKKVNVQMPPLKNVIQASGDADNAKGLVCVVFKTSALFPTKPKEEGTEVSATKEEIASNVVLLSLGTKSIENIDPPLELNFTKGEPKNLDPSKEKATFTCVYYDKKANVWSTRGCETVNVDESRGGEVSCRCNHMTSFAILMAINPIPDYIMEIQSQMTNPLLGISLFFILLMLGTVLPFKQLWATRSMKIHLSLTASMGLAISVFLLTNLKIKNSMPGLCKVIAFLVDYTYLVVFMWTLIESVVMYISLVQVFGGHISKYMLKFNLFCWLFPILSPITDYFLTEGELLAEGVCVINRDIRKWAFILPVAVILLINLAIFFSLLRVIAKAKSPDRSTADNITKQIKAVASISCMLGLGWIVSFFAFGKAAVYFQFAFIIINGTQGIFMFLFYCIGNEQYLDVWRDTLGIEEKKKASTSTSFGTKANTAVMSAPRTNTVTPATATPAPVNNHAVKATEPKNTAPQTARATRRSSLRSSVKKTSPTEDKDELVYENENVYDIIDDPDIKSNDPATITRI